MPRLSDIEVALTAEDKTGGAFASVTSKMRGLASAAGVVVGSAALVGGAFLAAAKSALDFASSIQDAAAAAGLSVETYQALRNEAGLAGVRQEEFASAMTRATKVIGDAANGNKAAAETFARLGVGVRTAAGEVRPTEDVIRDLSDRIAAMGSQAEKSSAAAAVFGRSAGPALVPMLEQGSQGIDAFIASGKEMGLVLSEELIRKGDDAGDKLDILANTLKTTFYGALLEVAPLISEVATGLAEAAVAASDWWQAIRGTDAGEKRIQRLADAIRDTAASIEAKSATTGLERYLSGGDEAIARLRAELKVLEQDMVRTAQSFRPAEEAPPRTTGVVGQTAAEIEAAKAAAREQARLARERAAAEKAAIRDSTDFEGAEQIRSQMATEAYYAEQARLRDEFVADGLEQLQRAGEAAVDEAGAMALANVAASMEAFESIEDRAAQAAERTLDAFDQILFAGFRDGADGMLDAFKGVVAEMVLELARAKLKQALTDVFGSILSAFAPADGSAAELSKSTSSAGSGLAKFATGGSFVVPGSSTGDKVVPLFRANGGERVTIAPAGGGGSADGGGITIVQNISAPGATAETVALIRAESAKAARTAVGEVINMKQRGRL